MTGSLWPMARKQDNKQKNWPKHPVLGYAPGDYMCKCITCGSGFFGDKRSVMCGDCAMKHHAEGTNTTHFHSRCAQRQHKQSCSLESTTRLFVT